MLPGGCKHRKGRDPASVSQFLWLRCVGLMRLVSHIPRYCILFVCVGCAFAACYGQTSSASALKVVAKEARDLPVAGASCSLSAVAVGKTPVAAARSDDQGIVRFTKVLPGRYTLTVTKEGEPPGCLGQGVFAAPDQHLADR